MILLNDILRLPDIKNVKVRFNLNFGTKRPAIDYFTDQTEESKQLGCPVCRTKNALD